MKCLNKHLALVALICGIGILIDPFSSYAGINEELWSAAREGNTGRVKALLGKGADVNAKDSEGNTALTLAVKGGHGEIIKLLKQHTAVAHPYHDIQRSRPTKAGENRSTMTTETKVSGEAETFTTKTDTGITEKKQAPAEDDVTYWLNKGAVCATYGNDKAALKYFKKVVELDSNNAPAHFNQGLCYGEIGQYDEAASSINRAIETYPEKASYFYGRGWVYLLSGDKEKAVKDFKRAAVLGNRDAQDYLRNTVCVTW
jgi:tetratricopeptide (TPR) repeat protein